MGADTRPRKRRVERLASFLTDKKRWNPKTAQLFASEFHDALQLHPELAQERIGDIANSHALAHEVADHSMGMSSVNIIGRNIKSLQEWVDYWYYKSQFGGYDKKDDLGW